MAHATVTFELPPALLERLGAIAVDDEQAREALVLGYLREALITQGQAAQLLGITRYDILDLMVRDQIPSGPETAAEVDAELESVGRLLGIPVEDDRG